MKKVCAKTFILLFALLFATLTILCVAQFCVPSENIAKADSTVTVIKAPVSNLEDNAYAGKSTVGVYDSNGNLFYIPESYYLCSPNSFLDTRIYIVTYFDANEPFRLYNKDLSPYELPSTTQINVSEEESLFPDVRLTLKDDAEVMLGTTAITNDFTIKLLGYNEDGSEIYACATYNGISKYGFIPTSSLEPFTVPYQQRAQAERDALLAAKEKPILPGAITPPDNTSVALRIILIIGISVPAIIIVLLLFKPSKDEKRYAKTSVRRDRSNDIDYDDPRDGRRNSGYRYDYDDRDYDRGYPRRDRDYERNYDRRDRDYDRGYDRRDDDYDRGYDRRDRY